jgi:hypothetical protein
LDSFIGTIDSLHTAMVHQEIQLPLVVVVSDLYIYLIDEVRMRLSRTGFVCRVASMKANDVSIPSILTHSVIVRDGAIQRIEFRIDW